MQNVIVTHFALSWYPGTVLPVELTEPKMHRIIKSHLSEFVVSMGFANLTESKQFERFANYCVAVGYCPTKIEPDEITTSDADGGIDGLAVVIDEEIVTSVESAMEIFESDRRNHDVRFIAVQAKSGESYELGELLKFTSGMERLFLNEQFTSHDELECTTHAIFEVVIRNANKLRGGKPSFASAYVFTGSAPMPSNLLLAFKNSESKFKSSGLFQEINFRSVDRDGLVKIWSECENGADAELNLYNVAPMPQVEQISESYLGVVEAKELVDKLLTDQNGSLRTFVFEENVRAFLGEENPVNHEISNTINDAKKSKMFAVLNNGITIVSPDVVMQGNTAHLRSFQIVNGCQTSNVLFRERSKLPKDMMVNVKIIETSDPDVLTELVRATNSQSRIDEKQFFSLTPISKRIEQYFNSFGEGEGRIYFERRERQYAGKSIPAIRVFDLKTVAKCITAMFLGRPDLSAKYQKRMFDLFGDRIFTDQNKEVVYYSASLVLYRLHLLVAGGGIPQNSRRLKWHLLHVIRIIVAGCEMPRLDSKKIEPFCQKIIKVFSKPGNQSSGVVNDAIKIINSLPDSSNEYLGRATIAKELESAVENLKK